MNIDDLTKYVCEIVDLKKNKYGDNNDKSSNYEKKDTSDKEIAFNKKIDIPLLVDKNNNNLKIERIGIDYEIKKVNVSFYSSLGYIINDKYMLLSYDDRCIYLDRLTKKLAKDVKSKLYGNKLHKETIKHDIELYKCEDTIIKLIANVLDNNIFVISRSKENITVYSDSDIINKYKNNIILYNFNNHYNPVLINDKKINNIDEINCLLENNKVVIYEDDDNVRESEIERNNNKLFVKECPVNIKMKYDEIANIAKLNNIDLHINNKKKTKSILIEEITKITSDKYKK